MDNLGQNTARKDKENMHVGAMEGTSLPEELIEKNSAILDFQNKTSRSARNYFSLLVPVTNQKNRWMIIEKRLH